MSPLRAQLLEKWRRFQRRSPEERVLILRAAAHLPLTRIGLRLFGFQRWKELIEKASGSSRSLQNIPGNVKSEAANRSARAVRSAELHGLTRPNCLERSLTLWWLLRREGIEGELQVGARRQGDQIEAHAWVELDGRVLNDREDICRQYSRFDSPIAAGVGSFHTADEVAFR